MGVAAAVVSLAAGIVVAAGIMIIPDYVSTAGAPVYKDIEEWSPQGVDVADVVRTPKGLAATVLEPNEVLSPGSER